MISFQVLTFPVFVGIWPSFEKTAANLFQHLFSFTEKPIQQRIDLPFRLHKKLIASWMVNLHSTVPLALM